jgi:hypothetical protein
MISSKFKKTIKLNDEPAYRIAHQAGLDPNTLSKIICGIVKVKFGDPRVVAVGRILGISENECFDMENFEAQEETFNEASTE